MYSGVVGGHVIILQVDTGTVTEGRPEKGYRVECIVARK